jgi:hypothetical protein
LSKKRLYSFTGGCDRVLSRLRLLACLPDLDFERLLDVLRRELDRRRLLRGLLDLRLLRDDALLLVGLRLRELLEDERILELLEDDRLLELLEDDRLRDSLDDRCSELRGGELLSA